MIREYKTAMTKNRRVQIGDKVIYTAHFEGDRSFYGKVQSIYRIGESRVFLKVLTNYGEVRQVFACHVYGGTN